jgi:type III secretion protein U
VARSQEVVTTVSLTAIVGYLWLAWGSIIDRLVVLFNQIAVLATQDFRTGAPAGILQAAWDAMVIVLPVLGITIVAGIAANYMQFGSIFFFESITPKMQKISPAAGFKRIFR